MTAITGLTEDFEGGADGALITTTNTIFTNLTGDPTFLATPDRGLVMRVTTAGTSSISRADFPVAGTVWQVFEIRVVVVDSTPTAILNWFSGTLKIGDLRLMSDGSIQLRDKFTAAYASPPLTQNVWHRLAVKMNPGSLTGHRVRIYQPFDATTVLYDSGDLDATAAGGANVDNTRLGLVSVSTGEVHFNRVRGDDATEPAGPAVTAPLVVDAGADQANIEPYATVTLTATATGGSSVSSDGYSWSQPSGERVTLSGTGASRTFTAPATQGGATLTFQVTATDSAGATSSDTVAVAVLPHNHWTRTAAAAWAPIQRRHRTSAGTWA